MPMWPIYKMRHAIFLNRKNKEQSAIGSYSFGSCAQRFNIALLRFLRKWARDIHLLFCNTFENHLS